jgi:hypothetical protein
VTLEDMIAAIRSLRKSAKLNTQESSIERTDTNDDNIPDPGAVFE